MNGLVTRMVMVFEKCIPIPLKACGRRFEITCVHSRGNKDYLSGYVAMAEFRRNLKQVSPKFIAALVVLQSAYI
jgi:hypothetical protein